MARFRFMNRLPNLDGFRNATICCVVYPFICIYVPKQSGKGQMQAGDADETHVFLQPGAESPMEVKSQLSPHVEKAQMSPYVDSATQAPPHIDAVAKPAPCLDAVSLV